MLQERGLNNLAVSDLRDSGECEDPLAIQLEHWRAPALTKEMLQERALDLTSRLERHARSLREQVLLDCGNRLHWYQAEIVRRYVESYQHLCKQILATHQEQVERSKERKEIPEEEAA